MSTSISTQNTDQAINFNLIVHNICSKCGFPLTNKQEGIEGNILRITVDPCATCNSNLKETLYRYISDVRYYIGSEPEMSDDIFSSLTDDFERKMRSYFS